MNHVNINSGHLEISASAYRYQHCHWNWHWHQHCKNFIFALEFFSKKIEHLRSFLCLVMASVPLCCIYFFPYDFLLIHPEAFIGVLAKGNLNFWIHLSTGVSKKYCSKNFFILPSKTSKVESILSTHACLPGNVLEFDNTWPSSNAWSLLSIDSTIIP